MQAHVTSYTMKRYEVLLCFVIFIFFFNLIKQRWVEWMEQVSFTARYRKTTSVQFISSDDLNTLKVLTSQLPQRGNETFF